MFLPPLAQFLPFENPLGFGIADFVQLGLAAILLIAVLFWRPWCERFAFRLAQRPLLCLLLFAVLPIALRLALLPRHPAPVPDVYDEFDHLLVADTLRHLRLANPPHSLSNFFETFFVLQHPTYSSTYPLGQGIALALGWTLFGAPWAGVIIPAAALCSLCYWMLRGWTTPAWALLGGLFAVIEFGPLNQWMNSYWGGGLPAAAGCLVFGALPRLKQYRRLRDAAFLGVGLAIYLLTRPYESIFLVLCAAAYLLTSWRSLARPLAVTALAVLPAILLTLLQNKQVTGSWITPPYVLGQYQYGVPSALTFRPDAVPHVPLTPQQELDYKMQLAFRGAPTENLRTYFRRLIYRIRYYPFFFLPPLYLGLPCFFATLKDRRYLWAAAFPAVFALGINFFPAFQYHYMAAVTCIFVLISIAGLRQLYRWNQLAALALVTLCIARFGLEYVLQAANSDPWSLALRNPERRVAVAHQLAQSPGQHLVFVRYWPQHIFQDEWVYNAAQIDAAPIVWARDLGTEEDEKLRRYYPRRTAWLLEPDARPPRLTPYPAADLQLGVGK